LDGQDGHVSVLGVDINLQIGIGYREDILLCANGLTNQDYDSQQTQHSAHCTLQHSLLHLSTTTRWVSRPKLSRAERRSNNGVDGKICPSALRPSQIN
jgi:hypothetical protein